MNMKPIMNKKGLFALVCALMGMTFSILTSCSDDLDVQQSYPFTVETMPVPKRIVKGETVEIRCELKREGRFSDARYTIRYFQPDGEGKLRMDDGMVLLPNDRYPLDREVFRLYYTSECEDQQSTAFPADLRFQQRDGGRGYRSYVKRRGTACCRITMNLTCLWE